MIKKFLTIILCGSIFLIIAANQTFADTVYIIKEGKEYYPPESRFTKNKHAEEITLEEAIACGLQPSKDYLQYKERINLKEQPLKDDSEKVKR